MKDMFPNAENPTITRAIQDLMTALRSLFRSEVKLVQTEVRFTLRTALKDSIFVAISGVVVILGFLSFMTFLVIGLGRILGENYWLSALIIGVAFMLIGATTAALLLKKLSYKNLSLPHSRQSIHQEAELVQSHMHELKQNETWRKAS